jgi:hypothetical protein
LTHRALTSVDERIHTLSSEGLVLSSDLSLEEYQPDLSALAKHDQSAMAPAAAIKKAALEAAP